MTYEEQKQKIIDDAVKQHNEEMEKLAYHLIFVGDDSRGLTGLVNQPGQEVKK